MAGGQELLVSQIAGDLGHEMIWNLGEKKEATRGSVLPYAGDAPWWPESV